MSQGTINRFRTSKVVHTVENGFCTVCSESEDWLTTTGQECTQLVPASELQRGDEIFLTRENGKSSAGTMTVTGLHFNGETVTVMTRLGDHEYPNAERVHVAPAITGGN